MKHVQIDSLCSVVCLVVLALSGTFWMVGDAVSAEPPITDLAFTRDGKTLIAVSQAGIQEFSWPKLELQRTIESKSANIHCVMFSPDGKSLAIGGGNPSEVGIAEVFSWPTAKRVAEFTEHEDSVLSVAWLDETRLVTAGLDRQIYQFDLQDEDVQGSYAGHSRGVSSLCVLPDHATLISTGHDQSVRVWNSSTGKIIRSLSQHTEPIRCVALRPAEGGLPMVATAANDRTVRFWQPTIGRMVRFAKLESSPLKIAWNKEGTQVIAVCEDGWLRVIDPVQVKVVNEVSVFDGWAYAVAVHPSDGSFAVGGDGGQVRRVDAFVP